MNAALSLLAKITRDFEDPTLINVKSIYLTGIFHLVLQDDNDYAVALLLDARDLASKRLRMLHEQRGAIEPTVSEQAAEVDTLLRELTTLIPKQCHLVQNAEFRRAVDAV